MWTITEMFMADTVLRKGDGSMLGPVVRSLSDHSQFAVVSSPSPLSTGKFVASHWREVVVSNLNITCCLLDCDVRARHGSQTSAEQPCECHRLQGGFSKHGTPRGPRRYIAMRRIMRGSLFGII